MKIINGEPVDFAPGASMAGEFLEYGPTEYERFLHNKAQGGTNAGFAPVFMPDFLFDFQGFLCDWSNPGDVVWSPFAGIGSEGYCAIQMGRKFIGSELKESYFGQAKRNMTNARNASTPLFEHSVEAESEIDEMEDLTA
jgi:hypothetical protein